MRNQNRITPAQARQLMQQRAILWDVRTPAEYAAGHIPSARNVPLDRLEEEPKNQKHFQSAYLFVRQISFQLMPGLPQLKGRCTLPPFHKAHHLPTLPTRV